MKYLKAMTPWNASNAGSKLHSLSATVRTQTFGAVQKPTIYYIMGYGTKIAHFTLHIKLLNLAGYRVVAFEHNPSLLDSGQPEQLKEACEVINTYVSKDTKSAKVAGIYGISLGTFIALYIGSKQGLNKLVLSAGLDSFARLVMEQPRLGKIRKEFMKNGYDESALYKAWEQYDYVRNPQLFSGKSLLVMDSKADNLIKYEAVLENKELFIVAGANIELIATKRLGHAQVVIWNCFRLSRTLRFFRTK